MAVYSSSSRTVCVDTVYCGVAPHITIKFTGIISISWFGSCFDHFSSKLVNIWLSTHFSASVLQIRKWGLNKACYFRWNIKQTTQNISKNIFISDSNMSQNTLSKSYTYICTWIISISQFGVELWPKMFQGCPKVFKCTY